MEVRTLLGQPFRGHGSIAESRVANSETRERYPLAAPFRGYGIRVLREASNLEIRVRWPDARSTFDERRCQPTIMWIGEQSSGSMRNSGAGENPVYFAIMAGTVVR